MQRLLRVCSVCLENEGGTDSYICFIILSKFQPVTLYVICHPNDESIIVLNQWDGDSICSERIL